MDIPVQGYIHKTKALDFLRELYDTMNIWISLKSTKV